MADTGKGYAGFFAGKKAAAGRSAVGRKIFSTASEKIAEEMYQFEGPGWQWLRAVSYGTL